MTWVIDEFPEEPEENGCRIVRLQKHNKRESHDVFCDYDSEGRVKPYEHHRWYDPHGSDDQCEFYECDEYISDLDKIKIPKYIICEIRKIALNQAWKKKDGLK